MQCQLSSAAHWINNFDGRKMSIFPRSFCYILSCIPQLRVRKIFISEWHLSFTISRRMLKCILCFSFFINISKQDVFQTETQLSNFPTKNHETSTAKISLSKWVEKRVSGFIIFPQIYIMNKWIEIEYRHSCQRFSLFLCGNLKYFLFQPFKILPLKEAVGQGSKMKEELLNNFRLNCWWNKSGKICARKFFRRLFYFGLIWQRLQ